MDQIIRPKFCDDCVDLIHLGNIALKVFVAEGGIDNSAVDIKAIFCKVAFQMYPCEAVNAGNQYAVLFLFGHMFPSLSVWLAIAIVFSRSSLALSSQLAMAILFVSICFNALLPVSISLISESSESGWERSK